MKEALEKETKSVQQIRHNHHEVPNTHDYLNETMIAEDCDPQSPLKQVHRKKQ